MKENNKLARALLEQNGIDPVKKMEADRVKIHQQIEKQQTQVNRMKWIAYIAVGIWFMFGVALYISIVLRSRGVAFQLLWKNDFGDMFNLFGPIMIALVVFYYLRKYRLNSKIKSANLFQIQDRLANIEEQLQKLSKKD